MDTINAAKNAYKMNKAKNDMKKKAGSFFSLGSETKDSSKSNDLEK